MFVRKENGPADFLGAHGKNNRLGEEHLSRGVVRIAYPLFVGCKKPLPEYLPEGGKYLSVHGFSVSHRPG